MKDKTVIITGASRGIGASVAAGFAARGAFVFVNYRVREKQARDVVEAITAAGGHAELLPFDVRDPAQVEKAIDTVAARRERIDILVNNAAVVSDAPVLLMSDEQWARVIDTDLTGVFNVTRAVAARMMSRKQGVIVNVGSVAAVRASRGQANYSAAKGGVMSLTRALAAELAPAGIRVNAVVPGFIDAGIAARLDRDVAAEKVQWIPMGKLGEAGDVTEAVLFFASERARYITGQALAVDGGLSL
jgi:3-oxoacyl-[acyl-carrier protein] reductase